MADTCGEKMKGATVITQKPQGGWIRTGAGPCLVERLTDRQQIGEVLSAQRTYAAYAIGQLDDRLFPLTEWWLARGDGGQALLCHSRGGLGNALFATGDPAPLEAALRLHPGSMTTFATCQPEHLPVMRRFFRLQQQTLMLRMAVDAQTFRPAPGQACRLLGHAIYQINRLYNSERPGDFYTADHIDAAVYYGVFADGRLVSIAGTHVVSPTNGIAVVGNVFTHPRNRGRGYATIASGAVTAHLLSHCHDVVLTVDPNNAPAVRAYRRLGYQDHGYLIETPAMRRPLAAVASLARRLAARWGGTPMTKEGEDKP